MRIKTINPVAKALAHSRRRTTTVPAKKGKGSYNRKTQEKPNAERKQNDE